MTHPSINAASRLASSLLVGGFLWSAMALSANAQDVSKDQILKALAPAPITRSLTGGTQQPSVSPQDQAFIETLRHRTRSLSLDESDHVAEIAKTRAKIDLEIFFDYNSSAITAKAEPQLAQLAQALRDPSMDNAVVVLAGHTDARGGDEYNQALSERRAEAVKTYLIQKQNVPAQNLSTAGYGKRDLKNPAQPYAPENRRVQIVNMSAAATADNKQ